MAFTAGFRSVLDSSIRMARTAFDLRVFSFQCIARLAVVKIDHPVGTIMATLAVRAKITDMGLVKIWFMPRMAVLAGSVVYTLVSIVLMAYRTLHRSGIIINLMKV